jgi:hypothetical protein
MGAVGVSAQCIICGASNAPRRDVGHITTNVCETCISLDPSPRDIEQVIARLQDRPSA